MAAAGGEAAAAAGSESLGGGEAAAAAGDEASTVPYLSIYACSVRNSRRRKDFIGGGGRTMIHARLPCHVRDTSSEAA